MIWKKFALSCILSFLFFFPVQAESIRGLLSGIIDLSDPKLENREFSLGLEELVAIIPGEKAAFLSHTELILQIPSPLRSRADSFILLVYKRITPAPHKKTRRYRGIEEAHFVLSNRPKLYISIPISQGENGSSPRKTDQDTLILSQLLTEEDFPILLALLPLSKGIFPEMAANSLSIKAVPRWNNRGALVLSFAPNEIRPENTLISIDGENIPWRPELILPSGMHILEIEAEKYRRVSMEIAIQEAETTRIEVPMVRKEATLSFEAPEQALIFLDGERIDLPPGSSMKVEEGPHTATILLHDYRVSKQFFLKSEENLKISLLFDILIQNN